MQDNAFGRVRVWASAMRWKKHPTFNKSQGEVSCQAAYLFFTKLCFGWFTVQYFSKSESPASVYQAKQQKMRAFSHQCRLMSVILLLLPHPVSVPGSQKALSITGIRKHCFSQRLRAIVSASCPCGRHNVLTPVDYRMGIQCLLKSLCQDTSISNPWPSYYTSWS